MNVTPENRLVVVAGLPGAGKSTLLARLADGPELDPAGAAPRVLDSDLLRRWFARRLPRVPYRAYRGAVHAVHALWTLLQVMLGPRHGADALLVHATTRGAGQRALARFARAYGWRPVLVVLDVPVADALAGQADRGRVVNEHGFARHVRRWRAARSGIAPAAGPAAWPWDEVRVVGRQTALAQVRELLRRRLGTAAEPAARR
ncbi:AAA family ATPase [Myceligenerans crystallogenes]|uniref:AAA domain-containing protein n=1 Tax=Myceligenerans crystallogenes TaxID=316335 RepID=A0ABN2NLT5_9MICO